MSYGDRDNRTGRRPRQLLSRPARAEGGHAIDDSPRLLRTFYDPTLGAEGSATSLPAIPVLSAAAPENPRFVLDQLWVNFDVGRTVFVTAGKQHVKWGVGKFWNPTDYLHPVKRDPLAVFDDRAGTSMLKVHLPWEKRGWNAYGVAFLEDLRGSGRATGRLGRVAGGGRVEVVLGTVELAADALVQAGSAARYGLDASAGIWDLDVYAELALQEGTTAWGRGPAFDELPSLRERLASALLAR